MSFEEISLAMNMTEDDVRKLYRKSIAKCMRLINTIGDIETNVVDDFEDEMFRDYRGSTLRGYSNFG